MAKQPTTKNTVSKTVKLVNRADIRNNGRLFKPEEYKAEEVKPDFQWPKKNRRKKAVAEQLELFMNNTEDTRVEEMDAEARQYIASINEARVELVRRDERRIITESDRMQFQKLLIHLKAANEAVSEIKTGGSL